MTERVAFEDLLLNDDGTLNKRARVQNAGWTDEEVAAYRAERQTALSDAADFIAGEVEKSKEQTFSDVITPAAEPETPADEHTLTIDELPSMTHGTTESTATEVPKPLPGYKEIGEGVVEYLLKTYPTAGPLDWRRMQSGMQYANRLGGTWSKKTRG